MINTVLPTITPPYVLQPRLGSPSAVFNAPQPWTTPSQQWVSSSTVTPTWQPPIFTSLDIDNTLVPWGEGEGVYDTQAFERYKVNLNRPNIKGSSVLMLNSGRGLGAVQAISHLIKHFPVRYLGLSDGQQLFIRPVNPNAPNADSPEAVETWLKNLTPTDADPTWYNRFGGFHIENAMQTVARSAVILGYAPEIRPTKRAAYTHDPNEAIFLKPIRSGETAVPPKIDPAKPNQTAYWVIKLHPDQAYFDFVRSDGIKDKEGIKAQAQLLDNVLGPALAQRFPQVVNGQPGFPSINHYLNTYDDHTSIHIGPEGCSKSVLVHYVVSQKLPQKPLAIISGGDSKNDFPSLGADSIAGVRNFPVMVGDNASLTQLLIKNWEQLSLQWAQNASQKSLTPLYSVVKTLPARLDDGIQDQIDAAKQWVTAVWAAGMQQQIAASGLSYRA
ncbi:MAG: hypothetical protein QE263_00260 [Vampirovibrionales bacterium]|nr:hypothetical protein [Vampirovibrionales bacterium]